MCLADLVTNSLYPVCSFLSLLTGDVREFSLCEAVERALKINNMVTYW